MNSGKIDIAPENADLLFENGTPVKSGKVREVRRNGEIFIKLDRRKHHSFRREFQCAAALLKCGIPVVEPLFFTSTAAGAYLATAAFNGVPASEYLKKAAPHDRIFESALELLLKMLNNGFIHTDFHLGNLLYSPENNFCTLVDVDAVKKVPRWLMPLIPEKTKFHLIAEFSGKLDKKSLTALMEKAGITDTENFYRRIFKDHSRFINHEWQKRRKQILGGYPKFTIIENGTLIAKEFADTGCPDAIPVSPGGRNIFLAGFYLELLRIPHRKVVRLDTASDTVWLAPAGNEPPTAEMLEEMNGRMMLYGIETTAGQWGGNAAGTLPEFNDLQAIAGLPLITKGLI